MSGMSAEARFWLSLLAVALLFVAARLFGFTELLFDVSNACVVVIAGCLLIRYLRHDQGPRP